MHLQPFHVLAYRFSVLVDRAEIGHAYLYLIFNDRHKEPYGLLEDLYVDPDHRSHGIGTALEEAVEHKARSLNCYKFVGTSRNDGTRTDVQAWCERRGFERYGTEFRMDMHEVAACAEQQQH